VYSDDIEASWGYKNCYGYKMHILCDAESGFIICGYITTASNADSPELINLLNMACLEKGAIIFADRGYPSFFNRKFIKESGFVDKVMYKSYTNHPISEYKKNLNKKISKIRSKIESIFGTLKNRYNLHRSKFLGILKLNAHFLISSVIFNLKKIILSKN
jgi:IS5 family transposase